MTRPCAIRPDAHVMLFHYAELAGGKVKTFFDRVKVRDLYDIGNLEKAIGKASESEETVFHQAMLYYASISARFPQSFEGRSERFADRENELRDQLFPMLKSADKPPVLQGLMSDVEAFVKRRVLPRTDEEREYLRRFAAGDYRPGLLFSDKKMADAAAQSPAAQWKLRNLEKMRT